MSTFRVITLTIPSGQSDSNVVDVRDIAQKSVGHRLTVASPVTLPETVNLKISLDEGATFIVLQSGGADIVLPAGKATQLSVFFSHRLKLVSTGAVAADRVFQVALGGQG